MSKTMPRAIVAAFAFGLLSLSAPGQAQTKDASLDRAPEPITIDMTADHWQVKENAEFLRQLGFFHGLMRLNTGDAVLKEITFSNGTIEFDVNTIGRGAPGIAFRQQDEGNFELLYLRPDPNCPAFRACMQYAPQTHGVLLWDLFPQYETLGLKTTIASDRKQTKKVDIGWTRELWVFVNGKLVYADKNLFDSEAARKFPDGRCSLENGAFTLPLEAGDNEVAIALANNFFGWGLMLRLADPEGVHLAAK
jgi:hypothetical protein